MPKSRVLTTQTSPLERLRAEIKDISRIQPLALRGEITTWQYDAKNCIAIFYRVIDNELYSRRLLSAIKNWAKFLLTYASALGFDEEYPTSLCIGRPTILQGYYWLSLALRSIGMFEFNAHGISFAIDSRISEIMLDPLGYKLRLCALYHAPLHKFNGAVRYRCEFDGTTRLSGWCGKGAIVRLCIKIERAVRKHRNPKYRKDILDKMRSKKYNEGRIRAGYRKA